MPFGDRNSLSRVCCGFIEASLPLLWTPVRVGALCPSCPIGTECLPISGYFSPLQFLGWNSTNTCVTSFWLLTIGLCCLLKTLLYYLLIWLLMCSWPLWKDHQVEMIPREPFLFRNFPDVVHSTPFSALLCGAQSGVQLEPVSRTGDHVFTASGGPERTLRKWDECACCPLFFSLHALNVASVNKMPFCSLKSSQPKVSTDFYSPHLPFTMCGFNNANFSQTVPWLLSGRKSSLKLGG